MFFAKLPSLCRAFAYPHYSRDFWRGGGKAGQIEVAINKTSRNWSQASVMRLLTRLVRLKMIIPRQLDISVDV